MVGNHLRNTIGEPTHLKLLQNIATKIWLKIVHSNLEKIIISYLVVLIPVGLLQAPPYC